LPEQDSEPVLVAHELTFEVDGATLVDDVSLTLRPGELVGLVGANGAGKTTLLRMLAGVLTPSSGWVELDGQPLRRMAARDVARISATVPQQTDLTFELTSLEYAVLGRHPHLGRFQLEGQRDTQIAREALGAAGVGSLAERALPTLSGGERQGVYVARGLAQEPRILLVDEPTASLDLRNQVAVMELLRKLAVENGLAVLVALHDLSLVAQYSTRILMLRRGEVVANGAPGAVLNAHNIHEVFGVRAEVRWEGGRPAVIVQGGDAPLEDLSEEGRAAKKAEQDAARQHPERRAQGLVIVNTGNGKGKTTASLGLLFRAWGRDLRVVMFQFIKATTANFGENRAADRLGIEMIPLGAGFTWMSKDIEKDRALAAEGWQRARERLLAGTDDVVVLDELTYLMKFDWLDVNEVIAALRERPSMQHVIITGRDAPPELMEFADLVTEMREVKHPYKSGIKAQPGVEF
jgi:cob(I)alamin adenosyltransferase